MDSGSEPCCELLVGQGEALSVQNGAFRSQLQDKTKRDLLG